MTEPEAPQPRPSGDRAVAWRRLLVQLGAFVVAALGLIALAHLAPHEPRRPFDEGLVRRVKRQSPDFVLVGNSMVQTRFDQGELNRLLSPARVAILGVGGSKSAYWYLTLKNVVLPTIKPKRVLLFFRRRELTTPREKATGVYAYDLGRVRREREPRVDAKLAPPTSEPIERLGYELGRIAPFPRLHALAHPVVEAWAHRVAGATRSRARRREQRALDAVFATDKLRNADIEPTTAPVEKTTLDEVVDQSLLPDIIEVMARAKVPLTLVRVRTRADADGRRRQSPYDRALDKYLERRGIELIDMSGARWESADLYGEGDHIAPRQKLLYTRLFVQNLRAVFR